MCVFEDDKIYLTFHSFLFIMDYNFSFWRHALNERVGDLIYYSRKIGHTVLTTIIERAWDGVSRDESVCEMALGSMNGHGKVGLREQVILF